MQTFLRSCLVKGRVPGRSGKILEVPKALSSYLFVPLLMPLGRTHVFVDIFEELAGLVILALQLGAAVKVDVVLPAVPRTGVRGVGR